MKNTRKDTILFLCEFLGWWKQLGNIATYQDHPGIIGMHLNWNGCRGMSDGFDRTLDVRDLLIPVFRVSLRANQTVTSVPLNIRNVPVTSSPNFRSVVP